MIKVALCDDDSIFTQYLTGIINSYTKRDFEIYVFNDPQKLLDQVCEEKKSYDLMFLDVEMPQINGMDLAQKIVGILKDVYFIFISGYDRALDAFRINALDYIVKPIKEENIMESLDRFVDELEKKESLYDNSLFYVYKNQNQYLKVNYMNILFFEKIINKVILHYIENGQIYTFASYISLNDIEKQLNMNYFYRCHKSFIVNRQFINHLKDKKIVIKPYNISVDVSRHKIDEVKDIIKNKLFEG